MNASKGEAICIQKKIEKQITNAHFEMQVSHKEESHKRGRDKSK